MPFWRVMRDATVTCMAVLATAGPLSAQAIADTRRAFVPPAAAPPAALIRRVSDNAPSMDAMVFWGLASGVFGIAAGAALGASLEECQDDEWFCGLAGGIIGGSVGGTIMIPVGVHLASSRASFGRKLLGSTVTGVLAWALAYPTAGVSLLAAPFVQLGVNIRQEQNAWRRLASNP